MMRKRLRLWVLLYKKERDQEVWIYDKLRRKEINNHKKHGWKVVDQ